jgi:hypothetical protein
METGLRCLICGHDQCGECVETHGPFGLSITCCHCGFSAVHSFWTPQSCDTVEVVRSGPGVCDYCGHVRCENCYPDDWPNLSDGCCKCRKRLCNGD